MNKKIITILIVLMGISILGIIAVQLVWLNNAVRVKNELFNRSVNEALQRTAEKLEDIHNFGVVNQMVFNDSLQWLSRYGVDFEHDFNFDFEHPPHPPEINDSAILPPKPPHVVVLPKTKKLPGRKYSYSYSTQSEDDSEQVIIKNNTNKNEIIVLKNDTIVSDFDSLINISVVKIDSVLSGLDSIGSFAPDISKRVSRKAGNLKKMAGRVVTEIFSWDVNNVDQNLISEVLHEELQNRGIPIDFRYGIIRDSIIELQQDATDSLQLANSAFQVDLYPNNIFENNIKLAVFFPGRESFIYRSLNWLLLASLIFSLFILTTFALSIFYILRQKKISEMKSDFINNMTHEFKTPIATISVATDSITNDKVVHNPERIKYFAGMIKKENARMNQQVEDILTIARLDKKDFEFNWESIDVHELIQDAIEGIKLQIVKREGKIDTRFQAANPVITTDKNHCTNLVYNLLDNAIKYSDGPPDILVSTENRNNGVWIAVADKGIGMSKNVQAKIFEKFYRQSGGNIHNVKGFGLGLSYVKAVVEANHGTISVKSEPGKGSKFDVFLPFVRE